MNYSLSDYNWLYNFVVCLYPFFGGIVGSGVYLLLLLYFPYFILNDTGLRFSNDIENLTHLTPTTTGHSCFQTIYVNDINCGWYSCGHTLWSRVLSISNWIFRQSFTKAATQHELLFCNQVRLQKNGLTCSHYSSHYRLPGSCQLFSPMEWDLLARGSCKLCIHTSCKCTCIPEGQDSVASSSLFSSSFYFRHL